MIDDFSSPSLTIRSNCSVADGKGCSNLALSSFGNFCKFTSDGIFKNGVHTPWIDGQSLIAIAITRELADCDRTELNRTHVLLGFRYRRTSTPLLVK